MTTRCHDCAFTHGTEASNSPQTLVVANMCALTGEIFECHVNKGSSCFGWCEARVARMASPHNPSVGAIATAAMLGELTSECVRLAVAEDDKAHKAQVRP